MDPEDVMDVLTEHPKFKPVVEALEPYDRKELVRLLGEGSDAAECKSCIKLADQVSDLEDDVEARDETIKGLEERLEVAEDGLLVKRQPSAPAPVAR